MRRCQRSGANWAAVLMMGALASSPSAAGAGEAAAATDQDAVPMAAGTAAKLACSGVFVSHRSLSEVVKDDIEPTSVLMRDVKYRLNPRYGTVTATKQGVSRVALYRPGVGCTLVVNTNLRTLRRQAAGLKAPSARTRPGAWPLGDTVDLAHRPPGVDAAALDQAVRRAFTDDTPSRTIDTRALIVVYDGRIVAEQYAPGFNKGTRLLGWSASKSVLATLIGTLVSDGKLNLDAPAGAPEWGGLEDPRHAITVSQLLHMSSGLSFDESYIPGSDSTTMLFERGEWRIDDIVYSTLDGESHTLRGMLAAN